MGRGRILVVDDDSYIQLLVAEILERQGYEVYSATNGEQAIEAVRSTPINVVLLDLHLPDVEEPAFVQLMHQRGLNVPVVIMCGSMGAPRWADRIDAVGALTKPFTMSQLISAVDKARELPTCSSSVAI